MGEKNNFDRVVFPKFVYILPKISKQLIWYLQVARDKAVKNWTFIEGLQFEDSNYGSGYPNGELSGQLQN